MKSSIAQANPSENIYEIYYRLKQKGKENEQLFQTIGKENQQLK